MSWIVQQVTPIRFNPLFIQNSGKGPVYFRRWVYSRRHDLNNPPSNSGVLTLFPTHYKLWERKFRRQNSQLRM